MPLVNKTDTSRKILASYRERKIPIPCFGVENTFTMEGILKGAANTASASRRDVAVFVAVTGNYHGRQQLKNYSSLETIEEGFLAFRDDLRRLTRTGGAFERVHVIASLDHGQPGLDEDLIEEGRGFWGCVMVDCSTMTLDENRARVAEFVRKNSGYYLVEGCVDEITESGDGRMKLTDADDAKRYLEDTNVDLMVVNLGTEHRAMAAELKYRSDIARKIYEKVGFKLVLHGTSSLSHDDLSSLRDDGIAKVNIWTVLETETSQNMVVELIRLLRKILPAARLKELLEEGWLGSAFVVDSSSEKPELKYLTEVYRRNKIKVPSVALLVEDFMGAFGFTNF
ncbi:MAG: class II fructose-bisphosphate aldolase [Sedimentisphaerales bacterium]|nr:class II fructose-bisphosphate aldolase [Sedimentisphaerales bacterium]